MTTVWERIAADAKAALDGIGGPTALRDEGVPQEIPAGGLLVLRTGEATLTAGFAGVDDLEGELRVECFEGAAASLDSLRAAAIQALLADPGRGGLAIDTRLQGWSDLNDFAIGGARPFEGIEIAFRVRFWTAEGDPEQPAP